ncbi:MAG TPA: DUF1428 domain-containing protein [Flavobacteriales bacterium]|jgi:uncharacterized protein YbaA (DUF1428 family)|nr:DUF1428 domain-containing protein [Flavobacteriales bacterium]
MANYVDGFVLPLPKKNVQRYTRIASRAAKVWMEHGALAYYECLGDDLLGLPFTFPKAARAKADETVMFSWIMYRNKKHRDQVNARVMADPRMLAMMKEQEKDPLMDHKRMAYGGFRTIVIKTTTN